MNSSGASDEKVVVVKKVPAFPIPAQLKLGGALANVKILRLNTRGLMAEVGLGHLKMGDKCEISFELPVLHHAITESMVVIKQYNHWQGGAKPKSAADLNVAHLVEMHFAGLSAASQERIVAFLKAAHIVD